jgi:predicted ABC-type ATPase
LNPPRPSVVILAGPNGAGKSTAAPDLLHGALEVNEFVNADVIARGLSAFDPDSVAIAAGRVMLARIRELAEQRVNFAFETTLASRSLAPRIRDLLASGYAIHLVFLWLSSADLAVQRVAARVAAGGHNVPEQTVRRRYQAGIRNFFGVYEPIVTTGRSSTPPGRSPHWLQKGWSRNCRGCTIQPSGKRPSVRARHED